MPFTWLDIALFAVMLISGILALMRGFTREVLSIVSWLGAAAATAVVWFNFPDLHDMTRQYIQPNYLADIVLAVTTFIVILILLSALTARLSDRILESEAGALDRTLGFVFGVARGLVLLVITYLLFTWLVPRDQFPSWVKHARTLPLINSTADAIISYLPDEIAATVRSGKADRRKDTPAPQPKVTPPSANPRDTEYRRRERRGLNQLVESSSEPGN